MSAENFARENPQDGFTAVDREAAWELGDDLQLADYLAEVEEPTELADDDSAYYWSDDAEWMQ